MRQIWKERAMKREADEGWAKVAGAFEQSGGISGPLRFRLGNGGEKRKREEASPRLMRAV